MRKKSFILTLAIVLIFLLLSPVKSAKASTLTEDQSKFINAIKDEAIISYEQNNILPSLTIAQAILESSWGKSTLASKGNNLFGVKAYSDWTGSSIRLSTKEYVKGKYMRTTAKFKSYSSLSESIKDHSNLLSSDRYSSVRNSKNYTEACNEIYKCGYATSPTYSSSLIKIINCFELYKYDIEASTKKEKASSKTPMKSMDLSSKLSLSTLRFNKMGLQYNLPINN